jgi:hypothetical protein
MSQVSCLREHLANAAGSEEVVKNLLVDEIPEDVRNYKI